MRNPSALVFALLGAVVLTGCGSTAVPQPMKSEAGGFEVETPITLKEETQNAPTPIGNIVVHMFTGELKDRAYVVGYSDYPDALVKMSPAEKLLDGARDGAAGSFKGKIVEEKKINIDGNPGRELLVDANYKGIDATLKARICLVKSRLYQVMVVGEKGKISAADMDAFVQSFKLIKK